MQNADSGIGGINIQCQRIYWNHCIESIHQAKIAHTWSCIRNYTIAALQSSTTWTWSARVTGKQDHPFLKPTIAAPTSEVSACSLHHLFMISVKARNYITNITICRTNLIFCSHFNHSTQIHLMIVESITQSVRWFSISIVGLMIAE